MSAWVAGLQSQPPCNLPEERKATAPLNFQHQQKSFKSLCHSILSSEPSPGLADCSPSPTLPVCTFWKKHSSEGGKILKCRETLEHFSCVFLLCLRSQQEPTYPTPPSTGSQMEILGTKQCGQEEVENRRMQLHPHCTERKKKTGPQRRPAICPRSHINSEVDLDQSPRPGPQPSFSHTISSWVFQVGRPSSTRYCRNSCL